MTHTNTRAIERPIPINWHLCSPNLHLEKDHRPTLAEHWPEKESKIDIHRQPKKFRISLKYYAWNVKERESKNGFVRERFEFYDGGPLL